MQELEIRKRAGIEWAKNEIENRYKRYVEIPLSGIDDIGIVYLPSNDIKNQIDIINNLYNKVESYGKSDNIIIDSYHSATIEGASTTINRVKLAMKSGSVNKSDKMVVNSIKGMYMALSEDITINNIDKLWKLVTNEVCENVNIQGEKFRNGMVFVGNESRIIHTPEKPDKIEEKIRGMFRFIEKSKMNTIIKAIAVHFYFVYIHPMCDGNGRTARIIQNYVLNKYGYTKVKYLQISKIINDNLGGYYKSLKDSEYMIKEINAIDITPFIIYMLYCIEESMIYNIANKEMKLSEKDKILLNKMKKHGRKAEITVRKCSEMLKESESTSRIRLNKLSDSGILIKRRVKNKNIYILK